MGRALTLLLAVTAFIASISGVTPAVSADSSGPGAVVHWGFDNAADPTDSWRSHSAGQNVTVVSGDMDGSHSGAGSLKIECLRFKFDAGRAAVVSNPFQVQQSKKYVVRLWMRARAFPKGRFVFLRVAGAASAERNCSVPGDWTEFTLDFTPELDGAAEIWVGYQSIGKLWLDDVTVSEGSIGQLWLPAPSSNKPPRKGNLVYNGSFEVGPDGWGRRMMENVSRGYSGGRHIDVTAVKTDAVDGQYALRVDSTEWLESEYIHVRPGQEITVSAWMKAEKEARPVALSFADGAMIRYCQWAEHKVGCELTTEWRRFSVSGRLPATADNGIVVRIDGGRIVDGRGPFLVDAVQVEEGDLSPFAPAGEPEVALERRDSVTGIYRPGAPCKVRLWAYGKPNATIEVASQLEDYYGQIRRTFKTPLELDAKGGASQDLEVELPAPGIYRLVSDAEGAKRPGEVILLQAKKASVAYSGVHMDVIRPVVDFVQEMGFAWCRLHDHENPVLWRAVEGQKGAFVYDDEAVDARLSTGVKLVGCLYGPPEWAQGRDPNDPDSITLPHYGTFNVEEWKGYVEQVVRHFKGKIDYWEVWNEPGEEAFRGPYLKLLKETYPVIKEENPDAFVVGGGGGISRACPELEYFFANGALECMDVYSFLHGYPTEVGREPWEYGEGLVELMRKYGKVVPLWDTEVGVLCTSFRRCGYDGGQGTTRYYNTPYRTAVNVMLRQLIAERAIGVEADFWYVVGGDYELCRNNEAQLMTLVEYDMSPRATVAAIVNSWDVLGECRLVEKLAPSDIARLYIFKHPDGAVLAVDTKLIQGMSAKLALPLDGEAVLVNAMGERFALDREDGKLRLTVSDEPFFVFFKDADAKAVADAAREAEFVGMPTIQLVRLLAIDLRNELLVPLRGARYGGEADLGFGLDGWLWSKDGRDLLVFAGNGSLAASRPVTVSDKSLAVYDSLGEEVPVERGRITIADGVPYVAVGDHPENSVRFAGKARSKNLLQNPSFDEGDDGNTPSGWSPWKDASEGSVLVKQKGGRTPESAGMALLVQSPKDKAAQAGQWVQRPLKKGELYGLSAWLRAERPIRAELYLSSRTHDENGNYLGATENRSQHHITTSWVKYSTSIVMEAGKGSDKDALVAVITLFEDPSTTVEIDDAELVLLGKAQ